MPITTVRIKYQPKDKNASALLCQVGVKSFKLAPHKPTYVDVTDWEFMQRMTRFAPLIKSGTIALDERSPQSEPEPKESKAEGKLQEEKIVPVLEIPKSGKPERLPLKTE
jgi:hypothetical protein